jgi:hypothetical protein
VSGNKITRQDIEDACVRVFERVPSELCNLDPDSPTYDRCAEHLEEVLREAGVEYSEVVCAWYNVRTASIEDAVRAASCSVTWINCDNCGTTVVEVRPPNGDWSHFQGCASEPEGAYVDINGSEKYICSTCMDKVPVLR